MDPTLTVLLYSSIAAALGGLGALPLLWRDRPPLPWLGWANALAAGTMLGAAYVLTTAGDQAGAWRPAVGAAVGIAVVHGAHVVSGTADLDLNRLDEMSPVYGYQVLLVNALHSAAEGVAIGAAMVVDLQLGIFMALAIALHNVPEGLALAAVLRSRGVGLGSGAGLAVAVNVSQVLLAVVVFSVARAAPGVLPFALGWSVGTLVQLTLVELLPESYRQAGKTSIALAAVVAMAIVVLLEGLLQRGVGS